MEMSETSVILEIDEQDFSIRLYESILKIDLKGRTKNKIIEALENEPVLRETIGILLGIFAPLHIRVSDIDSVQLEEPGKVRIVLPRHRDIVIPLKPDEAKKLVSKLAELIPEQKRKEMLRLLEGEKLRKTREEQLELGQTAAAAFPIQESSELMTPELDDEIEEVEEKEEQNKEARASALTFW
jgi:hypothetical protein